MEIYLPSDVEDIINRQMETGIFSSPNEVIVHALWLLDGWNDTEEEKLEKLRKAVQEGLKGPYIPGDEVFARLRRMSAEAKELKPGTKK